MKRIHLLMLALERAFVYCATPFALILADATKIEELQDRLIELNEKMKVIQAKADGENRALTTDEETAIENIFAQFEETEREIDRRTRMQGASDRLNRGTGRRTDPTAGAARIDDDAADDEEGANAGARAQTRAGQDARRRVPYN